MKFKEFSDWCNARCYDGCWGMEEAIFCSRLCSEVYAKSKGLFKNKKREELWNNNPCKEYAEEIVRQINKKIAELVKGEQK